MIFSDNKGKDKKTQQNEENKTKYQSNEPRTHQIENIKMR